VDINLPNRMLNHHTGTWVDLSGFDLFFAFAIEEADSTVPIALSNSLSLFDVVAVYGRVDAAPSRTGIHYLYPVAQTDRRWKFGLIPQKSNTFYCNVAFPIIYYQKETDASGPQRLGIVEDPCTEEMSQSSSIAINQRQGNFYLLEGICRYNAQGERLCYDTSGRGKVGGYAFHVKER